MKRLFILLLFISQQVSAQTVTTDSVYISNTLVQLRQTVYGSNAKVVFINLHANEITSVAAVKEYLAVHDGLLVELVHDTTRLVKFDWQDSIIQFDPNRIFSKKGRVANLRHLNGQSPATAEQWVAGLADTIIGKLKKPWLIVAMHNNTDGKPLSVKSYKQSYVNPAMDTDDFILTTEKKIFNQLKKKKINAVWQTQQTSIDDGSLSIYCDKKKIAYINIEAQESHLEEQLQMLNALTGVIEQYTTHGH